MIDWSTLSAYSEDESSSALNIFKQGCASLQLSLELLEPLFDTLECFPPNQIYTGMMGKPSFQNVRIVVTNMYKHDYLDISNIQTINRVIDSGELLQVELLLDATHFTPPTTFKNIILTLIDVMAGCSKMGLGEEEGCGIIESSRNLATHIFSDREVIQKIRMLHQLHKQQKKQGDEQAAEYWSVMAPFAFSYALLLDESIKSLDELRILKAILPKNLIAFSDMQEQYFGNCLTEASLRARDFYQKNIFSPEREEELGLSDIPDDSPSYEEQLRAVQENSIMAIRCRVEDGSSLHRKTAVRWLESHHASPRSASSSPRFFQSSHITQDSTPLAITTTPSVDSIVGFP